jgi:hypothetical protein
VNNPPSPASVVAAIADLTAWARRLSDAGRHADPAETAAYHAAKTNLLARLTGGHQNTDPDQPSTKDSR